MITQRVLKYAEEFQAHAMGTFEEDIRLALDFSWPSIGVVDLFLYEYRQLKNFGDVDNQVIRSAAAYIVASAHLCWERFCTDVRGGVDSAGVFIEGTTRDKKTLRVEVEDLLKKLLKSEGNVLKVIGEWSRVVRKDDNIISPFCLGIFLGLCPYGKGACVEETLESFKENIDEALKLMALTCANHYALVFPDEPLGQVAELYLFNLIYPPLYMKETNLAESGVAGLVDFFKNYPVSANQARALLGNLMSSTDELISFAAYAYLGAITNVVDVKMRTFAISKGADIGALRPAMVLVREVLGLHPDWITSEAFGQNEKERLAIEKDAGFLPWLILGEEAIAKKVSDQRVTNLLLALSEFDIAHANKFLDEIIAEQPDAIDFVLQRIFLEIQQGLAGKALSSCRSLATEPKAEESWRLYFYWGRADLGLSDLKNAKVHLESALKFCTPEENEYVDILGTLALVAFLQKDYSTAENYYNIALNQGGKNRLLPLLAAYQFYVAQNKHEKARQIQRELKTLAVYDRRVIANQLQVQAGFPGS